MDVHLDNPGGQESTSNSGKESSSTGNQQGHYPFMNKNTNQDTMLNFVRGGRLLLVTDLTKVCLWACSRGAQLQTMSV